MVLSRLAQKWPMKQHERRPMVEFGLRMPFNMQSLTKRQGACVDDLIWQSSVISDISNQVGYFHRIPEPWDWF
jgi:hypothetical protein